jgi:hypothetical protein
MSPETTEDLNLPTTTADGSHVPSTDVPDDPAASASAEIFAAMNGSTLTEAGDSDEYGGAQSGIDQQVAEIDRSEPAVDGAPEPEQ